jgi:hypothetical protein
MRFLRFIVLLISLAGSGGTWASDAAVRIGFLLNFSRFTEWPESVLQTNMPLTLCLAPGDAEMAAEFSALERQTVKNRTLRAIQISRPGEVARCHVLYLPADFASAPAPWLAIAVQSGTLTVSDRPDFVDEGGIIGLFLVSGRYRFDANLAQAKRANLFLGANLLKLARSVR